MSGVSSNVATIVSHIVNHLWRDYNLDERKELVESGRLPGSGSLPFTVKLGIEMVDTVTWIDEERRVRFYKSSQALARAIAATVTGAHEIWFEPETGEARISVETDHERTLLILALEGDRS